MRPGGTKDHFQFTERSFAACNAYNCHRQHYLQSNSKNVRTSVCDNFKLDELTTAFCNHLESSRIIASHLHTNCTQLLFYLSHVDFRFSRSEPFYKTLDIEQKAIFGQKKLALNKNNKSLA